MCRRAGHEHTGNHTQVSAAVSCHARQCAGMRRSCHRPARWTHRTPLPRSPGWVDGEGGRWGDGPRHERGGIMGRIRQAGRQAGRRGCLCTTRLHAAWRAAAVLRCMARPRARAGLLCLFGLNVDLTAAEPAPQTGARLACCVQEVNAGLHHGLVGSEVVRLVQLVSPVAAGSAGRLVSLLSQAMHGCWSACCHRQCVALVTLLKGLSSSRCGGHSCRAAAEAAGMLRG